MSFASPLLKDSGQALAKIFNFVALDEDHLNVPVIPAMLWVCRDATPPLSVC
jgi:hypothetical protein